MFQEFKREFLESLKSPSTLYIVFFRINQIMIAGGMLILLIFSLFGMTIETKDFFQIPALFFNLSKFNDSAKQSNISDHLTSAILSNTVVVLMGILMVFFMLAFYEFFLLRVKQHKFLGIVYGLILSFSPFGSFLFSIFGIYCFLNPEFQNSHKDCFPQWYKDLLSSVRLNFIRQQ